MKCRHCGAQLQELLLAGDPVVEPPKKAPLMPKRANVIVYGSIFIGAMVCAVAAVLPSRQSTYNPGGPAQTRTSAAYQTTAADLYRNYVAYEEAAKLTTGNSAIEISGTVKSIDRSLFNETEVLLDAGVGEESVAVTLEDQPGNDARVPTQGSNVMVRCENMTRILGPPTGQHCQLL